MKNTDQRLLKCNINRQGIIGQERYIAELYAKCGNINFSKTNYERAIIDFSNASKFDEGKSIYVFQLAKCLQEMNQIEDSLYFYEQAIERAPPLS